MTQLVAFLVRRPMLANLITVFALLVGALSLKMLTFETMPQVDMGIVNVTTARPGAGPQDMELSVTAVLEEEILKVSGVVRVVSQSMEGLSVITAQIDPDSKDRKQVLADLGKAVDRASGLLPSDVLEKPLLKEMSSSEFPVVELQITGNVSEQTLRTVARTVSEGLRELDGIAGVDKVGYRKQEVRVQLDPRRLERLGIGYSEIAAAIQRRNVRNTGGAIDSVVAQRNVLTVGAFDSPKQIEQVVLRSAAPGNTVRVRDVAQVVLDYEDWSVENRVDGRFAIALGARKKAGADGLETSADVRQFVSQVRATLPEGVKVVAVNDIARFTTDMLQTLVSNAALGLALVVLMLRGFFGWRLSLWVAVGLPVAIALTFACMVLLGLTVNILTIISLILVLGMLVDDAIVTGESIQAHRELGLSAQDASIKGVTAVARPVVASAITTILAFAPAAFLGGLEGEFLWALPVMIGLALLGSLLECKFLLPAHLAHGPLPPVRNPGFDRLRHIYRRVVDRCLRRRYLVITLFVVGFVSIMAVGGAAMRFNLYPEVEIDTFNVKVELPEGSSFEHTRAKTREVEDLIREVIPSGDITSIVTRIGHHDTDMYGGTEGRNAAWALVTTYLPPQGQRVTSSNAAIATLRERTKTLPGFKSLIVEPMDDAPTPGKPLEIEVIGDAKRHAVAAEITGFLASYPGVTEFYTSSRSGKDLVRLDLDYARLAARGLTVADVSRAVRVAFDGEIVSELQTHDGRVRYRLELAPEYRGKLETLESLTVPNQNGDSIKLRSVARLIVEPGEATIKRYFGRRTTTVYADIDRMAVSVQQLNDDVAAMISARGLLLKSPDLRVHFGGEAQQQEQAMGNVGIAFALCVAAVCFTLIVLFNSVSQPLLIMSVIPFGLTGVVVGFTVQGLELSLIALIGVIGLTGVLVNDSLVMVSRLNDQRKAGEMLTLAEIAAGATDRLRPIVITSLTTVAGLLPTAYGIMGSNPFITPMVMAMAWGVLFGTVVTLVLLPCLYAAEQDLRSAASYVFSKGRRSRPGRS